MLEIDASHIIANNGHREIGLVLARVSLIGRYWAAVISDYACIWVALGENNFIYLHTYKVYQVFVVFVDFISKIRCPILGQQRTQQS